MELIKELPNFSGTTLIKSQDETQIIAVKIYKFDHVNRIFLCYLNDFCQIGFIPLNEYSIYPLKTPFDEIGKVVYAYTENFHEELKMMKLGRKKLLEKQVIAAVRNKTVTVQITSFFDEDLAFCEFGAGLRGNISLAKYLYIKKAVNTIADVLQIGSTFKARIDNQYRNNFYALTTFRVDDYTLNLNPNDIVIGKVFAKLEGDDEFRYSYWFMITPQTMGIIKSSIPLGYGQLIKAKVHNINDNFIKFRFDSYVL